jgi:hypothetical protein
MRTEKERLVKAVPFLFSKDGEALLSLPFLIEQRETCWEPFHAIINGATLKVHAG